MLGPSQGPRRRSVFALTVAAATGVWVLVPGLAAAGDEPPEAVIGTFESVQAKRAAAGKPATYDFDKRSNAADSAADDDVSRAFADAMDAMENRDTATAQRKFEMVVAREPDSHLAQSARRYLAELYRGAPGADRERPAAPPAAPVASRKFETAPSALGAADVAPVTSDSASGLKAAGPALADVPTGVEEEFIMQAGDRVFFAPGNADLGQRARFVLSAQARWLASHPEFTAIVQGHADDGAMPDAQSAALSEARAKAVRDRLIEEGIQATRLILSAEGRNSPVATCAGPDCAAQNRRVVTVLKTSASRNYGQRSRGPSLASDGGRAPTQ